MCRKSLQFTHGAILFLPDRKIKLIHIPIAVGVALRERCIARATEATLPSEEISSINIAIAVEVGIVGKQIDQSDIVDVNFCVPREVAAKSYMIICRGNAAA